MANKKYLMAEMTWPELRETVREGRIAMMPVGIIEQHGPHLPLDTDILLAQEITMRAAARLPDKVVVVPPIIHGHSPHHMDFPGTLSVDPEHMISYVLDVCLSLAHHGFKKILMVNGHGSNVPVLDLVARQTILKTKGDTACASLDFWRLTDYEQAVATLFPESDNTGHADVVETSLYMAVRPDLVQLEKAQDDPSTGLMRLGTNSLSLRLIWSSFSKEGIFGTVSGCDRTKGEQLLEASVNGLVKAIISFSEKTIPPPVDHH